MNNSLFWMVSLPFFSSLLLGTVTFFSKNDQYKLARIVAPLSILISFILAITLSVQFLNNPLHEPVKAFLGNWIEVGSFVVSGTFQLDTLSSILSLIVTGIGFLIHVYSVGYMSHDEHQTKFFAYLNLFCGFMLVLITASSLPLLFVGWEGVGVCSFLLIGFWYQDQEKAFAGRKAFIVNRIGDAAFILAMALVFKTFGSFEFSSFSPLTPELNTLSVSPITLEWIAILLFIGCMGKSAQFPLYIWLPDAMAGPTPVSALIHAATMVTAGVYVLGRCSHLFMQAEVASQIVASIGLVTAIYAASIAMFQKDIKKVLAFSTVSQLGFMVLAMGVGAYAVGIFHLITHAYFKALLFLAAGSVIHALEGEQDIEKMGGLTSYLVGTTLVFLFGYAAIIGLPFFSGWFSKGEILHSAAASHHLWYFIIALGSALLTTIYMTRLIALTFMGRSKLSLQQLKKVHESPNTMLLPMWVLAALSFAGAWPFLSFFGVLKKLFPSHHHEDKVFGMSAAQLEWSITLVVILLAAFTLYLYLKKLDAVKKVADKLVKLRSLGEREYDVNRVLTELGSVIVHQISWVTSWFEKNFIDGFLHLVSNAAYKFGERLSKIQRGVPQTYALYILIGVVVLIYWIVGA